jgi:hypothetical protein
MTIPTSKVSSPLQRTIQTASSLGFEYIMFSPQGATMEHFFPEFSEAWDDVGDGPSEYQIIGEVSLEAGTPEEAAEEFVQRAKGGDIAATVRNANTDAISDVYLGGLEVTSGPGETIKGQQTDPSNDPDSDKSNDESEESRDDSNDSE